MWVVGLCGAMLFSLSGSTPATAGTQIGVEPFCSRDEVTLAFQALFPRERLVVNLGCMVQSRNCSGAELSLTRIESGKPLRFGDLIAVEGARLTHVSEHETQIEWGVNHFTVNFETGVVVYNTMIGSCRAPKAPAKP